MCIGYLQVLFILNAEEPKGEVNSFSCFFNIFENLLRFLRCSLKNIKSDANW